MRREASAILGALVTAAGPAAADDRSTALEEILVTAQHRTESAQETPISLFTFNEEQLEKQRISGLGNLGILVPNLTIDAFPANNQTLRVYIRGVGLSDSQITQDPAVGIYLDGAYIARSAGLTFDVADLERVEVLRGPQGTLYGRNTTAGAIKLITRKPDVENIRFDQTLSAGNNNLFSSKTSINLPFGEKYAAKLAYFYEDKEGFVNNDGPGGGFGDRESKGLRFDLRAEFSANLLMDYAYDSSEIESYNYTAQGVLPRESGGGLLAIVGDIAQNYIDYANNRINSLATSVELLPTDTKIDGHTLNIEWTINDTLSLRSISAYRELDDKSYLDFSSGSSIDFRIDYNAAVIGANAGDKRIELGAVRPHLEHEQWSQEFQLLGNIGDSFDYILGAYYFYEDADEVSGPMRHIFNVYPVAGDAYLYNIGSEFNSIENDAYAFFTQATWTPPILEERLHLTAGWRHSQDSREASRIVTDFVLQDTNTDVSIVTESYFDVDTDDDFDDDSFTFIAEYDLGETLNTYAKYAGAYKSGGYNIRDPEEQGFSDGFAEEKLDSYEIGLKGSLFDHMLRFSSAVFYQEYDDFQYNFQIPGTISGTRVFNVDEGELSGVELELTAMPTTGLVLQVSYAYLDSELDPVDNPFTGEQVEFNFTNAPEHTFSTIVDYTWAETAYGVWNVNASYSYTDDRQVNSDTVYRDSYQLIDASISLSEVQALGGSWRVSLWGKNLGEAEYEAFTLDNLPQADRAVIWGDGRSYGMDITYRYE